MASSFMGLYVQRDALLIAQKSLDITGNNISNINTPGYTRQRVDIVSVPNMKSTLGYNTSVSLAGQGSRAVGVAQIRDRLLDKKVRTYSADLCDVGIKMNTLSDVEDVFDSIEADELNASFASIISQFKAALQGFSADNADRSEMANITKNSAEGLVQCIVNYNTKLNDISEQTLEDTKSTVQRINAIFAEMGKLNEQIKESYISMNYYTDRMGNYEVMNDYGPLELKDEMNSLLDELSQYGNVSFMEVADGTFTVDFADRRVVEDKYYAQMAITKEDPAPTELEYVMSKSLLEEDDWYELNVKYGVGGDTELIVRNNPDDVGGTISISDKNTDDIYKLDSGSLRGYLDVYNGRGIYAAGTETALKKANEALDGLKAFNEKKNGGENLTEEELAEVEEYKKILKDAIGAEVEGTGPYTAKMTVNGTDITLLDAAGNAADLSFGGTVSVDGTATNAITANDVGGERGAETINDALQGLADINRQLAELNKKLDGTDGAESANKKLEELNNIKNKIAEVQGGTLSDDEKAAQIKALEAKETELVESLGKSLKSDVLLKKNATTGDYYVEKDGTASDSISKENIDIKDYTAASLRTQRNDVYEEAKRFINVLKDAGIDINNVSKDDGETYIASLKGVNLLNGDTTVKELSVNPQVEVSTAAGTTKIETKDMPGAAGGYIADDEGIVGNSYQGIEYYRDMLNSFVRTITNEFNGVYAEFGEEIFTYGGDFRTAAENFRITEFWSKNPEFIANPTGENKYEELDNVYINKLLGVFATSQTYGDGIVNESLKYPLEKFVSNISDEVGTQVGHEKNVYDATDVMLTSVETARSEVMDVGMDEEGINMMNYQKWYNAISRMITTMDEALDKLINGTGVVGL